MEAIGLDLLDPPGDDSRAAPASRALRYFANRASQSLTARRAAPPPRARVTVAAGPVAELCAPSALSREIPPPTGQIFIVPKAAYRQGRPGPRRCSRKEGRAVWQF